MNWLQKISQSKSMPLPVYPTEKERRVGDDGFDRIDDMMSQETAGSLLSEFPNIKWEGAGRRGVANECSPGIICKYTDDYNEAISAARAMKMNIPCIAKVHGVRKIQAGRNPLWMIQMTKVKTLSKDEQFCYSYWEQFYKTDWNPDLNNEDQRKFTEHMSHIGVPISIKEGIRMRLHINSLLDCLGFHGLDASDAHAANVGWGKNGLVLFDLGSTWESMGIGAETYGVAE